MRIHGFGGPGVFEATIDDGPDGTGEIQVSSRVQPDAMSLYVLAISLRDATAAMERMQVRVDR